MAPIVFRRARKDSEKLRLILTYAFPQGLP
jgi:hypothetical protein